MTCRTIFRSVKMLLSLVLFLVLMPCLAYIAFDAFRQTPNW